MQKFIYKYFDNWNGQVKTFDSFREAKKQAKLETGVSITVIQIPTNKIFIVPASGHTPA